jgi:hypothetical protein
MHEERMFRRRSTCQSSLLTIPASHPLLAQIPLTVSPFISLPTVTTLPYTYQSLPSTLPPTSTATAPDSKPKYVLSSSGHAAHPDEIINSCRQLQQHLQTMQDDADKTLRNWEDGIRNRDLAEKRRVAPGWLDSEMKILEPEKKEKHIDGSLMDGPADIAEEDSQEGKELDRAFSGMQM